MSDELKTHKTYWANLPLIKMDFLQAVQAAKLGNRVRRATWREIDELKEGMNQRQLERDRWQIDDLTARDWETVEVVKVEKKTEVKKRKLYAAKVPYYTGEVLFIGVEPTTPGINNEARELTRDEIREIFGLGDV